MTFLLVGLTDKGRNVLFSKTHNTLIIIVAVWPNTRHGSDNQGRKPLLPYDGLLSFINRWFDYILVIPYHKGLNVHIQCARLLWPLVLTWVSPFVQDKIHVMINTCIYVRPDVFCLLSVGLLCVGFLVFVCFFLSLWVFYSLFRVVFVCFRFLLGFWSGFLFVCLIDQRNTAVKTWFLTWLHD